MMLTDPEKSLLRAYRNGDGIVCNCEIGFFVTTGEPNKLYATAQPILSEDQAEAARDLIAELEESLEDYYKSPLKYWGVKEE